MNLQAIKDAIVRFKEYLKSRAAEQYLFVWESQQHFQAHWDIGAPDFKAMYHRALDNSETRRLWVGQNYEPKQMMLRFIELQPEFVREMFRDLFNEDKDPEGRIDRFLFHCDELLREFKEARANSIINNHYHHDDYHMLSLYLAFRYPDQYALHHFPSFQRSLQLFKAKTPPLTNDLERFFKVTRTLYQLLTKDPEVWSLHQARLDPAKHYQEASMLLSWEFMLFVGKS